MACGVDRTIKICNLKPFKINVCFSGHSENINACSFCFSHPYALTGSSDRTIKIWDYSTGREHGRLACTSGVYCLDIAISDSICVSGHRDGHLRLWNIRDNIMIKEIKGLHDDLISSVNYLPNEN